MDSQPVRLIKRRRRLNLSVAMSLVATSLAIVPAIAVGVTSQATIEDMAQGLAHARGQVTVSGVAR